MHRMTTTPTLTATTVVMEDGDNNEIIQWGEGEGIVYLGQRIMLDGERQQ